MEASDGFVDVCGVVGRGRGVSGCDGGGGGGVVVELLLLLLDKPTQRQTSATFSSIVPDLRFTMGVRVRMRSVLPGPAMVFASVDIAQARLQQRTHV